MGILLAFLIKAYKPQGLNPWGFSCSKFEIGYTLSRQKYNHIFKQYSIMKIILVILVYICISSPHICAMEQTNSLYIKCGWPKCMARYSDSTLLLAHIKAHEECEGKIHQCKTEDCKQYFYTKQHLESHARDYHPTLALAVAKKIKKCCKPNKKVKSPKKRKSRAQEIKIAPMPAQPRANPEPITLMLPAPFKVPFHPDTQTLLTCLERRRPMHEPGKKSILYKVPFKIANDERVKTTGALITQLIECPIKGCLEKFATTHGKLHHLIYVHKHELYTSPFES